MAKALTTHNTPSHMSLKKKRILITAGPTWIPIDSVRVISNIATGETGILLAEKLQQLGARVTLLLGPAGACCINKKIRLVRFRFFDELKEKLRKELNSKSYDILIHSAAVSDYRPRKTYGRKVKSGIKDWQLDLVPTTKIIDSFRGFDNRLFLVGFKFEPQIGASKLISNARQLIKRARLNLAVANTLSQDRYRAYIINGQKTCSVAVSKRDLVGKLVKILKGSLE
jgi:phosphopantothenoylcysteine decarboxylase/phosphopantothenate--cysteine ligase